MNKGEQDVQIGDIYHHESTDVVVVITRVNKQREIFYIHVIQKYYKINKCPRAWRLEDFKKSWHKI